MLWTSCQENIKSYMCTKSLHSMSGCSKTLERHRASVKRLWSMGRRKRGHAAFLAVRGLGGEKVGDIEREVYHSVPLHLHPRPLLPRKPSDICF